jgi:hypothetical protein
VHTFQNELIRIAAQHRIDQSQQMKGAEAGKEGILLVFSLGYLREERGEEPAEILAAILVFMIEQALQPSGKQLH